jgi:hypothetical protein
VKVRVAPCATLIVPTSLRVPPPDAVAVTVWTGGRAAKVAVMLRFE